MKKNLIKFQFSKNKSINSISRFMLSGIFLISFFYITPLFINFTEKNFNHKEFTNNSKNLLLKKLNTNNLIEEDITGEVNEMDLLYVILHKIPKHYSSLKYSEKIMLYYTKPSH